MHPTILYLNLFLCFYRGHNRHHAMPQRLKHDVDLDTMPLIAYNARVVGKKENGKSFFIQNQV